MSQIFDKIIAPFVKRLNSLLGKKTQPVASGEVASGETRESSEPPSEESVGREVSEREMKDIERAGKGVLSKAKPLAGSVIKKFSLKSLGITLTILIFLSLGLLAASKLPDLLKKAGEGQEQGMAEPTPTPVGYQLYKPSVYAGDPEILKLEEEINIFDREVSGAVLKETTLNPPTLDFNIDFKK